MSYAEYTRALDSLERFVRISSTADAVSGNARAEEGRHLVSTIERLRGAVRRQFIEDGVDPHTAENPASEITRAPRLPSVLPSDPIFIIGCRRSGTTLLANLLHLCPSIVALPETFFAGEVLKLESLFAAGHVLRERLGEPTPRFLSRVACLIDAVYRDYAMRAKPGVPVRWASKELFVSRELDSLDAMFDYRARFVLIVRHGVSVAQSCAERFPRRGERTKSALSSLQVRAYLDDWVSNTTSSLDFTERNPERSVMIRYEDLVSAPNVIMGKVVSSLGETWDESLLNKYSENGPLGGVMGDNKILEMGGTISTSAGSERWRCWPGALLRQLGRDADPTLMRLGYAAVSDGERALGTREP